LLKFFLTTFCVLAATVLGFSVPAGKLEPIHCGNAPVSQAPQLPLPRVVTGRITFYAAAYRNNQDTPFITVALNDPTEVFPTASLFKPFVVRAALQAVDVGRFKLETPFKATPENRSIESYPKGTNSLLELAKRAIARSDNTASDILQLAVGPAQLAREVNAKSACTTILLTTKAWWAAQGGLSSSVLGSDVFLGARGYAERSFEDRLEVAGRLIAASKKVSGPAVEAAIDTYFHGPTYTPDLELMLQNTTTAQAFTELFASELRSRDLKDSTRDLFRSIMRTGCCIAKNSLLRSMYRAAKAGSGWRILNLTGYVELSSGITLAYTYLNDQSDTLDSEDIEKQIKPVNAWIDQALLELLRKNP
jgi:beta-lactamase class A